MRTVIGWMAAMFASALLGAAVYQTVLAKPLPELDPTATVESVTRGPTPGPTLYRTEVRTIVEPTPTITLEEQVQIQEPVAVSKRTSAPAPTRTPAPRATPRASKEREHASDEQEDAAKDSSDAAKEAAEAAEDAAKEAAEATEPDD